MVSSHAAHVGGPLGEILASPVDSGMLLKSEVQDPKAAAKKKQQDMAKKRARMVKLVQIICNDDD